MDSLQKTTAEVSDDKLSVTVTTQATPVVTTYTKQQLQTLIAQISADLDQANAKIEKDNKALTFFRDILSRF